MLKQKKVTAQELYRTKKEKEQLEKLSYLPPGLINHGNTCFMNSVLQGLIATCDLYNLIHFFPSPHSFQSSSSRQILAQKSPQLTNEHGLGGQLDQTWVDGMPLGDVFINFMKNAWSVQDDRRREDLSPKDILKILSRKHDQYLDFRQQDAHEFLRLLLDAMRMEELDIIKKKQPPPEKDKKKRTKVPRQVPPASQDATASVPGILKLESFVDMLFGGKLASFLVCDKCKHITHSYEDFNDLSLSIKPEDFVKERKRNGLKTLAKKFGLRNAEESHPKPPRSSSVPPSPTRLSLDSPPDEITIGADPRRRSHELISSELRTLVAMGDSEGNVIDTRASDDKESVPPLPHVVFFEPEKAKKGDKESKEEDNWTKLGRRLSKSVRRKGRPTSRAVSSKLTMSKVGEDSSVSLMPSSNGDLVEITLPISPSPSPERGLGFENAVFVSRSSSPLPASQTSKKRMKSPPPPKMSREESAYLRHILAEVTPSSAHHFPLFKPTSAPIPPNGITTPTNNLWTKMSQLPGIEECLRWFTSVELMDGENMVGCRRCWKISHGMYEEKDRQKIGEPSESEESEESHSPSYPDTPSVPITIEQPPDTETLPEPVVQSSPELDRSPSPASTSAISDCRRSSLYNLRNNTSVMSLPTTIDSTKPKKIPPSIVIDQDSSGSPPPDTNTYGGFPIPIISTTAPETPSPLSTANTIVPNLRSSIPSTTLSAPRLQRRGPLRNVNSESDAGSEDCSDSFDETESETSLSDAPSIASPAISPNASQEHLHTPRFGQFNNRDKSLSGPSPKSASSQVPKSKQVIMRRFFKRYLISEPPPVLVIHLKRFQQISKGLMSFSTGFKKLDDYVTFPEQLDLTPFLAPKKEHFGLSKKRKAIDQNAVKSRCVYRLYAVVVHIGNMLGGHYIAYTALSRKDDPENGVVASEAPSTEARDSSTALKGEPGVRQWAYISDTVVRLTTLEEVLKSKAYICMYERIS